MYTAIEIKQLIKKHKIVSKIIRFAMRPIFYFQTQKAEFMGWLRSKGYSAPQKFDFIKKLRDTHIGERCFIVATGPSLTIEDLDTLKENNIYCLGMNSCVLALDRTDWIPDLLGIEDEYVYAKLEKALDNASRDKLNNRILISDNVERYFDSAKKYHIFPQSLLDHKYDFDRIGEIRFSNDCYRIVYDAYTITFSMMQLAVYMGFKEICLIGCDCNYEKNKEHFIEHGVKDPYASQLGSRFIYIHGKFKEYADSHGIKVFNCTRGGMLEVYPRKRLEDVLNSKNID